MPELPEVETMRRGVLPAVGAKIALVEPYRCGVKPITITPGIRAFRRRAVGRAICDVDRIGKRVVLRLEGEESIVFEPRMTGLVLLADPPGWDHLRLRLHLQGGSPRLKSDHLMYWDRRGLGSVRLLSNQELAAVLGPPRLGPDALQLTPTLLRQRLSSSRREIKVALLDQAAVAGIGNLYAAEILHLAHIHPQRRCSTLKAADWRRLHEALEAVLHAAIEHEGSTLSDGTYRNALNQQGGYQNHHRVYDRAGETCPQCKSGRIHRIVQAQRSTFYCPRCQRKPRNAT